MRKRLGDEMPLWIRINAVEHHKPNGERFEEQLKVIQMAVNEGIDAVHVTAYANTDVATGPTDGYAPHTYTPNQPGSLSMYAKVVRETVSVPVISFGRYEPDEADQVIADGKADFIAMGRKLLADPDIPNKLREGRVDDIRPCIYQYRCIGNIFLNRPMTCVVNPDTTREGELHIGDNLLGHAPPEVAEGLTGVLRNTTPRFVLESASTSTAVTRWWRLVATRLNRMEGGAVVTLTEVTDRRRAEIEAVQSRQALAHVGRVSTIGELTASLAHQLSQPLTGILSNAQATRRLLDRMPPDFTELREATSDIVDDARRAGEVVQKLRELLRRGELKMIPIDVSAVLRDIVHLITSDAIIRRITLALEIDNHPLMVLGDRVLLQQVLLNLIVNALEAIDEHADQRIVRVYCQRTIEQRIRIMVSDSGAGLPAGSEDLVFDPFYTTKPDGMGMGLSIAKSIVETHVGAIRARNEDGGGAVVEFWLPSPDSVAIA